MFGRGDDGGRERGPLLGCAGLAGGAVVLGVAVLAVAASCSGGDDGAVPAASTPARSAPPVTVTVTAPGGSPAPATSPTSPGARPSARAVWTGTIRLTDGDGPARDLDATPPRTLTADQGADIRGGWFDPSVTALGGARVAVVEARSRPGARACRDAVEAAGERETPGALEDGDVVCVVTGGGRVGRLVVTSAVSRAGQASVVLTATLWDGG
jgi:hypothetical protein